MTSPRASREDHERCCKHEGWRRVRDARGRSGTHHITYEFELADGRTRRTEDEFWACVREGVRPDRGAVVPPAETLPADLVHLLINRVGLDEAEVARMSKEEAVARLHRFWTAGS